MHYTLLLTEEIQGNQTLQLDKSGNEYVVGLYNKDTKEFNCVHYKHIADARDKYLSLVSVMINGDYSWKDRVEILLKELED